MIGLPIGILVANAGEWVIHKHILHKQGRVPGSYWRFHLEEHHQAASVCEGRDPAYEHLRLEQLTLSGRGGWTAELYTGAVSELGRGSDDEVIKRMARFLRTITQVTSRYNRNPDAVESADLRHADGYALRLRGVSTVVTDSQKK